MNEIKGRPVYGRVVMKKKEIDNQKTESGIIMGTPKDNLETFGEVVAVGDKVQSVKVGDIVLYNNLATKDFMLKGRDYLMVPEEAIYFILDESEY